MGSGAPALNASVIALLQTGPASDFHRFAVLRLTFEAGQAYQLEMIRWDAVAAERTVCGESPEIAPFRYLGYPAKVRNWRAATAL